MVNVMFVRAKSEMPMRALNAISLSTSFVALQRGKRAMARKLPAIYVKKSVSTHRKLIRIYMIVFLPSIYVFITLNGAK